MNPSSAMQDVLSALEKLLRAHKHYGQANFVENLLELFKSDKEKFTKACQSIDMWGGSGAVWDCAEFGAEEVPFRLLIIRLADEMKKMGISTRRSEDIASSFRQQNAQKC